MADKKMVEAIADMETDFAGWYTDVVLKAELARYSGVRGCMYVQPYGTALWENIRAELDSRFKATGHENVMLPMFIPESLLQKEKDHVEGFAPEVAWVTHGGSNELTERLCIRPTSETLFCDYFSGIVHSYRDLPKLYNQWGNVVRWEKNTRLFLRTVEFYWQEGHTLHETAEEAWAETELMLNIYADFAENVLAMPVIRGRKTDKEKFAGAQATYTIEALMHDGQALQAGTSHYFGDGFAKAFGITFSGRDGKTQYPHQTSWGLSTRIVGGIIMTHGDNNGLVLPPAVAPVQVVILPIAQHKEGVLGKAAEIKTRLAKICRVKLDESDNSAGWKFAQYEMKGVPLRLEIGPRDIENNTCVVVRRDNREKTTVALNELETQIPLLLQKVHNGLFEAALARREKMTHAAFSLNEAAKIINTQSGFVKAMWCGDLACELRLKETAGVTSRCIPFAQEHISNTCVCCGKPAKQMLYWGKAY
ncbi:MAG: proline--tRNA ligase [Clostridiales bacterium]|jgi:prolyl-tRNA synthetase|nr:proline--tRNA ligase [Clostridiales bacterium]